MPYNLIYLNNMEKNPIWISKKQNIELFEEQVDILFPLGLWDKQC